MLPRYDRYILKRQYSSCAFEVLSSGHRHTDATDIRILKCSLGTIVTPLADRRNRDEELIPPRTRLDTSHN
jgi:hypothetical protein